MNRKDINLHTEYLDSGHDSYKESTYPSTTTLSTEQGSIDLWSVGDIRWSLRHPGPAWLLADGKTYHRNQWPDLAEYLDAISINSAHAVDDFLAQKWNYSNASDVFKGGIIYGLAEGEDVLVAVGFRDYQGAYQGTIATSSDGLFWVEQPSGRNVFGRHWIHDLIRVPFSDEQSTFVASGRNGIIATSPDGILWTRRDAGLSGVIQGLAFDPDRGVLVAIDSVGNASTSRNGIHWTTPTRCAIGADANAGNTLTWGYTESGSGLFVAGDWVGRTAVSTDGIFWEQFTAAEAGLDTEFQVHSMSWGQTSHQRGLFIAGSNNGMVGISTDGRRWSSYSTGLERIFTTMCVPFGENKNLFVAAGYGSQKLVVSTDGRSWTNAQKFSAAFPSISVKCLAYGKDKILAAGTEAALIASEPLHNIKKYSNQDNFSIPHLPSQGIAMAYIKAAGS